MTNRINHNLAIANLPTHKPRDIWWRSWSNQAAVAAILRENPASLEPEVLLIKRTEHPHDRWSGHMAFPGGRRDREDDRVYTTAVRELKEEVGLDIHAFGRDYGKLSDIMAQPRRLLSRPLIVSPFIFWLESEPPAYDPDPLEVAEMVWVPLPYLANQENRESMKWSKGKISLNLPCYRYQSYLIWGLTLKMLDEMMAVIQIQN